MLGPGALLLVLLGGPARADCDDTDLPTDTDVDWTIDCDGDGLSAADGDCDDRDPDIRPGAEESCGDRQDNDCDGWFDEGCDRGAERGGLEGGGGCIAGRQATAGTPAVGVLVLPLLMPLLIRRRRR